MARVAVLVDRPADDPSWKGGVAWSIVNALAESQHDLQVFSPLPREAVPAVHARVGVARPAPSFGLGHALAWSRALVQFRPDIVHTLAPAPAPGLGRVSCWPLLEGLAPLLPRARRIATVFDADDARTSASRWLRGHGRWTVLDDDVARAANFAGEVDRLEVVDFVARPPRASLDRDLVLIPRPVDEWVDLDHALDEIAARLSADSTVRIRVAGGWGRIEVGRRRAAWARLGAASARVEMGESGSLAAFLSEASHAREIWSEPLAPGSWCARLARAIESDARGTGESVNLLSRIYSSPGRW